MDYFTELSQNYTGFRDIANEITAEDRKDPALRALAQVILNSLQNYREDLVGRPDLSQYKPNVQRQKRTEYLTKIRARFDDGISIFFDRFKKDATVKAATLKFVEKPKQPESPVEVALQAEVRSRLRDMSVADRSAALQNRSNAGDFKIFEAIENDPLPIPGFLGGPDKSGGILDNIRGQYVRSQHGDVWHAAQTAAHNLEVAELIRGVAASSGLVQTEVSVRP